MSRRRAWLAGAVVVAWVVNLGAAPAEAAASGTHLDVASPVAPLRAVRLFERPESRWGPGHRGIDLVAAHGQEVAAPGDGTVTYSGIVVDRGVVTVALDDGLVVSLEPVRSTVSVGERVSRGQILGTVGSGHSHCTPQVCLHLGIRRAGRYLNPLDVLEGFGPVRLLRLDR